MPEDHGPCVGGQFCPSFFNIRGYFKLRMEFVIINRCRKQEKTCVARAETSNFTSSVRPCLSLKSGSLQFSATLLADHYL